MSAEVLLLLLAGWQPLPNCHPPEFPFAQLPAEALCERCFQQCEADRLIIHEVLDVVGGWQRHQLIDSKCQGDRLTAIWYAAWWVTWARASAEQRDEWAEVLIGYIGADAFWRGELPLPLSLSLR